MQVDITPASDKISKNVKYRSRAPGQGVCLKGKSRTITIQGFRLTVIQGAENSNFDKKINKVDGP